MSTYFESRQRLPSHLLNAESWRGRPAMGIRSWMVGLTLLFLGWGYVRVWVRPVWLSLLPAWLMELLALVEIAGSLTVVLLWAMVWWKRQDLSGSSDGAVTIGDIMSLSPGEFERFVAQVFRRKGYRVKVRGRRGDEGVDLELSQPDGKRAIVQCKRHQNAIGPEIARELYGTLMHEQASHAFLVTTAEISDATRRWAAGKSMTLIDGATLVEIAHALLGNEKN